MSVLEKKIANCFYKFDWFDELYDAITKLYLNISFYIIFMKYYPGHTLFQNWIEKFKAYEKNLLQWVTKRNITLISVLIQLLLNGETRDVIFMPCNLRNFPCDFVYLFFCFNLKEPKLLLSPSSLFDLNFFLELWYCLILRNIFHLKRILISYKTS